MNYQYTAASFGTHWLSMPNQSGILGNLPLADRSILILSILSEKSFKAASRMYNIISSSTKVQMQPQPLICPPEVSSVTEREVIGPAGSFQCSRKPYVDTGTPVEFQNAVTSSFVAQNVIANKYFLSFKFLHFVTTTFDWIN